MSGHNRIAAKMIYIFLYFMCLFSAATAQFARVIDQQSTGCELIPPIPDNGRFELVPVPFNDGLTTGCVQYNCASGYELQGLRYNFCRRGQWTRAVPPNCTNIICLLPPVPRNGFFRLRNPFSSSPINYYCRSRLVLDGPRQNFCHNGTWQHTNPPRCVFRTLSDVCRRIRCIRNAMCRNGECSCRPGYAGNGRIRCDRKCLSPPEKENAVALPQQLDYRHRQVVTYGCVEGFKLVNGMRTQYRCVQGRFTQLSVRENPTCRRSLCSDPEVPEFGGTIPPVTISITWNQGDAVEFFCMPGFRLAGRRRLVCIHPDSFSESPTCIDNCVPRIFSNSNFSPNLARYPATSEITYRCDADFAPISGTNPVHVCTFGFFVGDEPNCTRICDPPEMLENGSFSPFNRTFYFSGEILNYECDEGFGLIGNRTAVCRNRTSFATPPSCARLSVCITPTAPPNGQIGPPGRSIWRTGDPVTYSCNETFFLVGQNSSTCLNDTTFDNPPPSCIIICISPVAPQNGSISPANQSIWIEGDNVTFSCDERFLLVGNETVTCSERSSFIDQVTCMAITCDAPKAPDNAFISPINQTTWLSGDVATFSCNDNYTLNGTQNINCTNDGLFENFTNTCLVNCVSPVPPQNGSFLPIDVPEFIEGDSVTFSCNEGFRLVGNATFTCLEFNSFVDVASCVVVTCGIPFTPSNSFILPRNRTTWFVGEMIRFMCEEHYLQIGIEDATCGNDGTFGDIAIDCLVTCIPPVPPRNGTIVQIDQDMFIGGDIVRYICDDGFRLVGNVTVFCTEPTSYMDGAPTCAVICSPPIAPTNGFILPTNQSEWIEGDNVTYRCNSGYRVAGREVVTCLERNSFADRAICEEFESSGSGMETCASPMAPRNGRIEPRNQTTWEPGESVQYICDDDFALEGSEFRVCGNNGSFNGTVPNCVDMESSTIMGCPSPRTPTSGRFEPANQTVWRTGEVVRFFCNNNFTLLGSNVSTCREDGSFDSLVPECVEDLTSIIEPVMPIGCLSPIAPFDGNFSPTMPIWNTGDVVMYFCNDNFTLIGAANSTCLANGRYNQPIPDCVASCPRPVAPRSGSFTPADRDFFLRGDTLTFTCQNNTMLIGLEVITCQRNHMFDPPPPVCLDMDEEGSG